MSNKKFTIKIIIDVIFAALGLWLADMISATFFEHNVWATVGFMIAIFIVLYAIEILVIKLYKSHKKQEEKRAEEEKIRLEKLKARREEEAARLAAEEPEEPPYILGTMTKEERQAAEIAIAKVYGDSAATDDEADTTDDEADATDDEEDDDEANQADDDTADKEANHKETND